MTLEELLDCDSARLKAMTDVELEEHFKPYFNVTRPELASRQPRQQAQLFPGATPEEQYQNRKKLELLRTMGINIPDSQFKKGKR